MRKCVFCIYSKRTTAIISAAVVLTFGPNPVRPGGEAAVFWDGDKALTARSGPRLTRQNPVFDPSGPLF
jgi:hypothetical protein